MASVSAAAGDQLGAATPPFKTELHAAYVKGLSAKTNTFEHVATEVRGGMCSPPSPPTPLRRRHYPRRRRHYHAPSTWCLVSIYA